MVDNNVVVGKKRGRPRKAVQPVTLTGDKENANASTAKRKRVKADVALVSTGAESDVRWPVLKALVMNRVVGVETGAISCCHCVVDRLNDVRRLD